jgi:hypothetical protein
MEAVGTTETSVNFHQTTLCDNPEERHLHRDLLVLQTEQSVIQYEQHPLLGHTTLTFDVHSVWCKPRCFHVFIFITVNNLKNRILFFGICIGQDPSVDISTLVNVSVFPNIHKSTFFVVRNMSTVPGIDPYVALPHTLRKCWGTPHRHFHSAGTHADLHVRYP